MGAELEKYCESECLVDVLGSIVLSKRSDFDGIRRRLDNPDIVGVPLPPRLGGELDSEWERVVTHCVRLVALGIDTSFQSICKRISEDNCGEHKAADIKGHARIMAKATSDHRDDVQPRPALNIDVVRCACTFECAAHLKAAAHALCAEFGGSAARVKNGFEPFVDGATSFHYRTLLVNWIFAPGYTYGELAMSSASLWDAYFDAPPDPSEPWGRWRTHASRALALLRGKEVSSLPVRFVCETQLLLRPYLEGRIRMHLLYKVVRAADEKKLHAEFASRMGTRWATGVKYEDEQRMAATRARAKVEEGVVEAGEVLWSCAKDGALEALRELLERCTSDIDWADPEWGRTPLRCASENGHADCVRVLLERGANVDKATPSDGMTPLWQAVQKGHADCVRVLLEYNADVDKATSNDGTSPVFIAAQDGYLDCMRVLIGRGADVEKVTTDDGMTALLTAAANGHTDCVCVLLESSAEVDKANWKQETAVSMAAFCGHAQVVSVLIAAKADLGKTDEWGSTPLKCALDEGHENVVRLLDPSSLERATRN